MWDCPRCSTSNQEWRNWCESCAFQRDHALDTSPTAATVAPGSDKVSPTVLVAVIGVLVVLALIAFFVLRPSNSSSSTKTASIVTTTTSTLPASDDPSTVQALLWSAGEFPDGWTSAPHETSSRDSDPAAGLASCASVPDVPGGPVSADTNAPDFTSADFTATMSATILADRAVVTAAINALSTPAYRDCLRDVFIRIAGPAANYPGVVIDTVKLAADTRAVASAGVRLSASQFSNELAVIDFYFLADGRSALTLVFLGKAAAFPQTLEDDLVRHAAERLTTHPT